MSKRRKIARRIVNFDSLEIMRNYLLSVKSKGKKYNIVISVNWAKCYKKSPAFYRNNKVNSCKVENILHDEVWTTELNEWWWLLAVAPTKSKCMLITVKNQLTQIVFNLPRWSQTITSEDIRKHQTVAVSIST